MLWALHMPCLVLVLWGAGNLMMQLIEKAVFTEGIAVFTRRPISQGRPGTSDESAPTLSWRLACTSSSISKSVR